MSIILISVVTEFVATQVWEYSWHDNSVLDQSLLIWQTSSWESRGQLKLTVIREASKVTAHNFYGPSALIFRLGNEN